ncbi:hypothetical protein L1887_47626 [Cichorium endivia]|nr:hypothetical protein L1887_47626 [Cichorium endivia]
MLTPLSRNSSAMCLGTLCHQVSVPCRSGGDAGGELRDTTRRTHTGGTVLQTESLEADTRSGACEADALARVASGDVDLLLDGHLVEQRLGLGESVGPHASRRRTVQCTSARRCRAQTHRECSPGVKGQQSRPGLRGRQDGVVAGAVFIPELALSSALPADKGAKGAPVAWCFSMRGSAGQAGVGVGRYNTRVGPSVISAASRPVVGQIVLLASKAPSLPPRSVRAEREGRAHSEKRSADRALRNRFAPTVPTCDLRRDVVQLRQILLHAEAEAEFHPIGRCRPIPPLLDRAVQLSVNLSEAG